ncbi:unnamed protein product [Allacma fusca]|uniref:Uncharacterized protein n=1 Tax=Allacma fusca TaxID=39272 RepID=A0A8J2P5H1_9HEXA|nr:unnamed protein product [Allacma fusca]
MGVNRKCNWQDVCQAYDSGFAVVMFCTIGEWVLAKSNRGLYQFVVRQQQSDHSKSVCYSVVASSDIAIGGAVLSRNRRSAP